MEGKLKKKLHPKEFSEYILPTLIRIGYQDIKVSEVDLIDDAQGLYRADSSEIRIKQGMEGRELLNTLLHECLHGIFYCYGLKEILEHDDKREEQIVNAVGNGLTEILIRNPDLVKFINKFV